MSHPRHPEEEGKPDLSPKAQADESHGSLKGQQLTGRNDPEINNSRGAETGGGVHRPGRHPIPVKS
ncbi:hypothetical protein QUC32_03375 [Novosphingobium resinovorum]|uniref:hypothetical protein n=1 Tax=Novosphingobium TaxID=165696 RepID=UPI001B3C8A6F|nr:MULTISPECIES: hypothetical protein [Novosphingobium]MBF7013863.1 hypothetical protein [Novosphingobium sp. HR1a]WJM26011.1 hypothetical protein QUC32_03375 [Novosphingobium resinovorum]